jgi:hypothetical protein
VLRREQRNQLQIFVTGDQVDVRHALAIDPAVIRDQADALASQRLGDVLDEHVDARPDHRAGRLRGRLRLRSRSESQKRERKKNEQV